MTAQVNELSGVKKKGRRHRCERVGEFGLIK